MNTPQSDQAPCGHCGRAEGDHDFIPDDGAELRRLSEQPRQAARRAAELVAQHYRVSSRDLLAASRSKLAPFPEARAELVCRLRRAGMPLAEIAEALGWDRSALYARERKARLAREAWDAAREREAGERLFAAALSVDPESGVRVVGASEDEGTIRLQVQNTSDAPAVVAGSFAVSADVGEASEPETLREKLTRLGLGDGTEPSEPETPRERFIRRGLAKFQAKREARLAAALAATAQPGPSLPFFSPLSPDELRALRCFLRVDPGETLHLELEGDGGGVSLDGPAELENAWRDEDGRLVIAVRDALGCTLRGQLVLSKDFDIAELVRRSGLGPVPELGDDCGSREQASTPEQDSPAVPVVQAHAEPAGRFSAGGASEAAARQDGAGPLWTDLAPVGGGDAEKGSAEAAEADGKQLAVAVPPPPHEVAGSTFDPVVGVLLVGHEGLEPPSRETAQIKGIQEGAENRGSTKAVAASAENLNTGTGEAPTRREEQATGAGVQVTREQGTLVQDCTRVGVMVGELLRKAEERGEERGAREALEALAAERAELVRVRQAWAALDLELATERERGRRLFELVKRARRNIALDRIAAADDDLRVDPADHAAFEGVRS